MIQNILVESTNIIHAFNCYKKNLKIKKKSSCYEKKQNNPQQYQIRAGLILEIKICLPFNNVHNISNNTYTTFTMQTWLMANRLSECTPDKQSFGQIKAKKEFFVCTKEKIQ